MKTLTERYQQAACELLDRVSHTQADAIQQAGEMVAATAMRGNKIYLARIVHGIERDVIWRGGGPLFYREYKQEETRLNPGDLLFLGSVSGRSQELVDLAYDSVREDVQVIALTSFAYSDAVEPIHSTGRKLRDIATLAVDMCAPVAEAMLEVEGLGTKFAASSGISSTFILWSITSAAVEKMMADGYIPGILKSINFPGGRDFNVECTRHYEKYGW